MGDIGLGLYAMVDRIRSYLPSAEIVFLVRKDLLEAFSLLEGVKAIAAPHWERGEPYDVDQTLQKLGRDSKEFDLIIAWPNPTQWLSWQIGSLVPRLKWRQEDDALCDRFHLSPNYSYIGAHIATETKHGPWRDWPINCWKELVRELGQHPQMRLLLFGMQSKNVALESDQIIDLRGKTTLFELLSLIKNRCRSIIVPDSGILSIIYYLDVAFPLQVVSLWADPNQGILKQKVASPNPLLVHRPFIGQHRDCSTIEPQTVMASILSEGMQL